MESKCKAHHWVIEPHDVARRRWIENDIPNKKRKFDSVCKYCNSTKSFPISTYETMQGNAEGLRGIKGVGTFTNHETITNKA